jgi:hypothetical protein
MEPSLGKTPVAFDSCGSDAQNACGFFNGKAPEVTQLNHSRFLLVESCQGFERVVECDEFRAALDRAIYVFVQGEFLKVLAALFRVVLTRVVDEQATHYLGGNSEKMGPVLPINSRLIYET